MSDIRHSYHEALLASIDLSIPVGHRHYGDLIIAGKESEPIFLEIQKRVLEEARRGRWAEVFLQLQRWVNGLEAEGCRLVEAQQRVQDILLILARFMEELGAKPDKPYYAYQMTSYTQLRSEVQRILHGVRRSATEMQEQAGQDLFARMKSFVLLHAHREISLDLIAEHFQISPFYVSRLFKEKFGTNYVDFLTDCRLEKAKELMTDEKKSLKEIAYEVGYHDPNYFSRVFKKSSGMAATEYRKELLVRLLNNSPSHESV
jgi:two-component system response regulator YesN